METKQVLGLGGAAALVLGVFSPLVHIPVVGDLNYFYGGQGDGVLVLLVAVASFVLVATGRYLFAAYAGVASLALSAFLVTRMAVGIGKVKEDAAQNSGELFGELVAAFVQGVQIKWGAGLLLIGGLALVVAGELDWRELRPKPIRPTVAPGVLAAALTIGGVMLPFARSVSTASPLVAVPDNAVDRPFSEPVAQLAIAKGEELVRIAEKEAAEQEAARRREQARLARVELAIRAEREKAESERLAMAEAENLRRQQEMEVRRERQRLADAQRRKQEESRKKAEISRWYPGFAKQVGPLLRLDEELARKVGSTPFEELGAECDAYRAEIVRLSKADLSSPHRRINALIGTTFRAYSKASGACVGGMYFAFEREVAEARRQLRALNRELERQGVGRVP